MAHTLAYDAAIMVTFRYPIEQAASVTAPTLVIAGEASFPFMQAAARGLAGALPNGHALILEGQTHDVEPQVLAPVLEEFLLGRMTNGISRL